MRWRTVETEDEKFKQAYESCEGVDIKEINVDHFIHQCETIYQMTTSDFEQWFETNQFEGNPEQQLWYLFSQNRS